MDRSGLKKDRRKRLAETLDYRPAKLVVIQRVRPKYVDPKLQRQHFIARLPASPYRQRHCRAGPAGFCGGREIYGSFTYIPPGAALQTRRDPAGAFNPGRLGGPGGRPAEAAA